ncbi:hypothetical protein J1614_000208 [Plenodomus biglobosus]|nr:hypothetical protein J1614_000208 [Plenodomus biglobosus]
MAEWGNRNSVEHTPHRLYSRETWGVADGRSAHRSSVVAPSDIPKKQRIETSHNLQYQSNQLCEIVSSGHALVQTHAQDDHARLSLIAHFDGSGNLSSECLSENIEVCQGSAQYCCGREMVHGKEVGVGVFVVTVEEGIGSHWCVGCRDVEGHMHLDLARQDLRCGLTRYTTYPVSQSPILCDGDEYLVRKINARDCGGDVLDGSRGRLCARRIGCRSDGVAFSAVHCSLSRGCCLSSISEYSCGDVDVVVVFITARHGLYKLRE